ncbi:DUF3168 domain-containing protein [Halodurantibacterium flavum]|uniref:DUF3168 domain-containing protein n=1 Tax=Halodurantibacterium flavum TaxID=1382802 RepID=A0ABW4S3F5_9RHOB
MSYGSGAALQAAVFQRLRADAALAALVGEAVHDAMPPREAAGTYVALGPEEVRDASDATGGGAEHRFVISVVSDGAGFLVAKEVAAAVTDALTGADLTLDRGRLVGLWFQRAVARRVADGRRVDLTFRARTEDPEN